MKRLLVGVAALLATTLPLALGLSGCGASDDAEPGLSPVSARPQRIHTPRGSITVPGPALLDGRDVESDPPFTVMSINVWSVLPGGQAVCQLSHGETIQVLSRKLGSRLYLEIEGRDEHAGCRGWVAAVFVAPQPVPEHRR